MKTQMKLESFVNSVQLPFTGYYFRCGQSSWEGKLESDNDDITADDKDEELETSYNSKIQQKVREHLFHHSILHYNGCSQRERPK